MFGILKNCWPKNRPLFHMEMNFLFFQEMTELLYLNAAAVLFCLFYWSIDDLQCCISFYCTAKWFSYTHTWRALIHGVTKIWTRLRVGLWRRLNAEDLMLLKCGVGEDSWESLGQQGDATSPFWRRSALGFLWKEWCWSWNSSTLTTSCEELTHWKRLWCWEGLGAGGEGDDRGWDGWMASWTRWTWIWVNSGRWWWTGRSGVLQFMGSQRVRHDWATELN